MTTCGVCDNVAKAMCGGCKQAVYCGSVCQTADWKTHSNICLRVGQGNKKYTIVDGGYLKFASEPDLLEIQYDAGIPPDQFQFGGVLPRKEQPPNYHPVVVFHDERSARNLLTLNNIDQVRFGLYNAKVAIENAYRDRINQFESQTVFWALEDDGVQTVFKIIGEHRDYALKGGVPVDFVVKRLDLPMWGNEVYHSGDIVFDFYFDESNQVKSNQIYVFGQNLTDVMNTQNITFGKFFADYRDQVWQFRSLSNNFQSLPREQKNRTLQGQFEIIPTLIQAAKPGYVYVNAMRQESKNFRTISDYEEAVARATAYNNVHRQSLLRDDYDIVNPVVDHIVIFYYSNSFSEINWLIRRWNEKIKELKQKEIDANPILKAKEELYKNFDQIFLNSRAIAEDQAKINELPNMSMKELRDRARHLGKFRSKTEGIAMLTQYYSRYNQQRQNNIMYLLNSSKNIIEKFPSLYTPQVQQKWQNYRLQYNVPDIIVEKRYSLDYRINRVFNEWATKYGVPEFHWQRFLDTLQQYAKSKDIMSYTFDNVVENLMIETMGEPEPWDDTGIERFDDARDELVQEIRQYAFKN